MKLIIVKHPFSFVILWEELKVRRNDMYTDT